MIERQNRPGADHAAGETPPLEFVAQAVAAGFDGLGLRLHKSPLTPTGSRGWATRAYGARLNARSRIRAWRWSMR